MASAPGYFMGFGDDARPAPPAGLPAPAGKAGLHTAPPAEAGAAGVGTARPTGQKAAKVLQMAPEALRVGNAITLYSVDGGGFIFSEGTGPVV